MSFNGGGKTGGPAAGTHRSPEVVYADTTARKLTTSSGSVDFVFSIAVVSEFTADVKFLQGTLQVLAPTGVTNRQHLRQILSRDELSGPPSTAAGVQQAEGVPEVHAGCRSVCRYSPPGCQRPGV